MTVKELLKITGSPVELRDRDGHFLGGVIVAPYLEYFDVVHVEAGEGVISALVEFKGHIEAKCDNYIVNVNGFEYADNKPEFIILDVYNRSYGKSETKKYKVSREGWTGLTFRFMGKKYTMADVYKWRV